MPIVFRPCPQCHRPMDASRQVCPACHILNTQQTTLHGKAFSQSTIDQQQQTASAYKWDLCGVTAMALGFVGICLFPILVGPVAIVLGIISLYRISNERHVLKGRDLAIWGICLGAFDVFWFFFGWLIVLGWLFSGNGSQ